MSRKNLLK